jgi:hypothetical protein
MASPKSAYMKTQMSPPKSKLSARLQHMNNTDFLKLFLASNSSYVMGSTALVDLSLLIVEILLSYTNTQHSMALLWMSDQPIAGTSS